MSELIKVLVVDDHKSMRSFIENEFTPEYGYTVVEGIENAADAVAFCTMLHPNLVIMDVCTKDGSSGLEATEKILKRFPKIKVIVTSGFDEVTYMPRAKEIGAHAFVYKINGGEQYRDAAKRVMNGEYVFPERKTIPVPEGETPFTSREMEVLRLASKGIPGQEIAEKLSISVNTVNRHIENMRQKAGVNTVMGLMTYVLSNGWINPNY